jgi:hypothetical protein
MWIFVSHASEAKARSLSISFSRSLLRPIPLPSLRQKINGKQIPGTSPDLLLSPEKERFDHFVIAS